VSAIAEYVVIGVRAMTIARAATAATQRVIAAGQVNRRLPRRRAKYPYVATDSDCLLLFTVGSLEAT
jgi:hypothetical protein